MFVLVVTWLYLKTPMVDLENERDRVQNKRIKFVTP